MQMKAGWALVAVMLSMMAFNGCSNATNATTGMLWVAIPGDQTIRTFRINESTGAATQAGNGVVSGAQPSAMAMTADKKTIFVANIDDSCGTNAFCNHVRAFSVNANDGTLAAQGNPLQIGGTSSSPRGIQMGLAVDPTGKFLFVAYQGNAGVLGQPNTVAGAISMLAISGSGLPSQDNPFPSTIPGDITGNGPSGIVASPVGNFLYVADQFTNVVSAYSYDPTASTVTLMASYAVGVNPAAVAFSRCSGGSSVNSSCTTTDSGTLFVANAGTSNNISAFNACIQATPTCSSPNGSLQPVSGSPFSANGLGPSFIMVDSQLDFVYVADKLSNEISQFSYSPATGALTAISPATASTGANPAAGDITGNGSILVVPNSGASNLSVFRIDNLFGSGVTPSGRLAPAPNPSFALPGQPSVVIAK